MVFRFPLYIIRFSLWPKITPLKHLFPPADRRYQAFFEGPFYDTSFFSLKTLRTPMSIEKFFPQFF